VSTRASPDVTESAFVSETASAVGDVTVGERASLWPFVCLRGDGGPTVVGEESNVWSSRCSTEPRSATG